MVTERTPADRPAPSTAFDWTMAIFGAVFTCGLFLDGWVHNHNRVDNTFFTPWHAVFFSGFALVALFLFAALACYRAAGYRWAQALPRGYRWSLAGVAIFALSGFGDMLWHMAFGIEANTAALMSPTHLGLATGMVLILAGPFRAAVKCAPAAPDPPSRDIPAVLALTSVLSILTFMSQYSSPVLEYGVAPGPPPRWFELMESRGIVSQLWATALMMGVLLLAVRTLSRRFPTGAITLVLVANAALMATQRDEYYFLPAVAAAGVIGDVLVLALRPSPDRVWAFRVFAYAMPFVYWLGHYSTYFVTGQKLYYSLPVWTGCIVITGFVGLLLSFLALGARGQSATATATVPP